MQQLITWLDAQAKHESDLALGAMRRDRSHAYSILSGFARMPSIYKFWPLEGDQDLVKAEEEANKTQEVSGKEFMSLFRATFRPN